ncbi:MAG: aspartate--ammonia ligase [Clostridia bacterium]|nr:aspartate--ammonia ligase [Clostridia bacterium]
MSASFIPEGYAPHLSLYQTQSAISLIKRVFQDSLARTLNLKRVSAPLFVEPSSGLNDDLNGVERPVSFDVPGAKAEAQVVHSLAKWKRMALYRYDINPGKGIYTDMNAIRRDEELDNLHSVYVDQWDWEKVITEEARTLYTLHEAVRGIVSSICDTQLTVRGKYPQLCGAPLLSREVTWITAQELEDMYPGMTPKERENAFVREHGTVFIQGIGGKLRSGKPHDGRAPDYDDWEMNGDILFWHPVLSCALEISSMGIRVSPESLDRQLTLAGCDDRRALPFHRMLLEGKLPLTMGGGIGQSRLCMLLLGKAHIGEVQSSIWDEQTHRVFENAGITLL